jgi:predicted ATPase
LSDRWHALRVSGALASRIGPRDGSNDAALVDRLLRECPSLHILTTSREPIGIPGEVAWNLAPLAPPEQRGSASLRDVERSPAVQVFVDRASAAQPSFVLGDDNASAVAQICRHLDRIPLALELAAARLDALTPEELAGRLDQRSTCYATVIGQPCRVSRRFAQRSTGATTCSHQHSSESSSVCAEQ